MRGSGGTGTGSPLQEGETNLRDARKTQADSELSTACLIQMFLRIP